MVSAVDLSLAARLNDPAKHRSSPAPHSSWMESTNRVSGRRYQIIATPISTGCSQNTNARYTAKPPTSAIASLALPEGNLGLSRTIRCFIEIRSTTAQARNPPKSSTSASAPLATKWLTAHSLTATSIGCFNVIEIRPGR